MNVYIKKVKIWYNQRLLREQMLVLFLGFALIYAIFNFIFFNRDHAAIKLLAQDINSIDNQVTNWEIQINALNKISESPLYLKWKSQEKNFENKKGAYRSLLKSTSSIEWSEVVKTILLTQHNLVIEQIKNYPETPFYSTDLGKTINNLYQQKLLVVFYSNYFDTLTYIKTLEKMLPTIHWDTLNYTVTEYPSAKIEMEFSILYERNG